MHSHVLTLAFAATLVPPSPPLIQRGERKATVDIFHSIADRNLRKAAPDVNLITSQKSWEKLIKSWNIPDAPKVDFTKEFLFVTTTFNRDLRIHAFWPNKNGDLRVYVISPRDECPGFFCYRIKSFNRNWVKTVNGHDLNEESPPAWRNRSLAP